MSMKLFMFFINAIFWLWLFIVPAGLLSFAGYWIYLKDRGNLPYSIALGVAGVALGILAAERVRRKYGFDNFFGRIRSTGELPGKDPGKKREDAS